MSCVPTADEILDTRNAAERKLPPSWDDHPFQQADFMNIASGLSTARRLLAIVLLPTLAFSGRLAAQSDGETVAETLREVRTTQQRMERKLDQLQATVEQLTAKASDRSKVTIHVQSPDGNPIAGYSVEMELDVSEGRVARVSGTSDDSGLAIARHFPYGEYDLDLSAAGWAADLDAVTVEVGRPLELTLVAPDPRATGKLIVQSDLQASVFRDLPFGALRDYHGARSFSPQTTPEPGQANKDRYPTLETGIERVAIPIDLTTEVTLEQPDRDKPINWYWKHERVFNDGQLIMMVDQVARIHISDAPRASLPDNRTLYSGASDDLSLGYLIVDRIELLGDEAEIRVPAGKLQLRIKNLYGELTSSAVKALSIEKKDGEQIWLGTELRDDSKWIDRIFELKHWNASDHPFTLLEQTLDVAANESATLTLSTK